MNWQTRILQSFCVLILSTRGYSQDVFQPSGRFPGGFPPIENIIPALRTGPHVSIGHVVFSYDEETGIPASQAIGLEQLEPISETVARSAPDASTAAIVQQQLGSPHRFEFEELRLRDRGDDGFVWYVTWRVLPKEGGLSGEPHRYVTVSQAAGNIVQPRRYVFDVYSLDNNVCIWSYLEFDMRKLQDAVAVSPSEDDAKRLAAAALECV